VRPHAVALVAALSLAPLAVAQDDAPPTPAVAPADAADLAARLDRLERQVALLDGKLDRLETLLRSIYAERIRRADAVNADPALTAAIRSVEERYHVRGALDGLIADDPDGLAALHTRLAKAAAAAGVKAFARDPEVATLLAAMASCAEYLAKDAPGFVVSITGRDLDATRSLALNLLDRPHPGPHEAALWAAVKAAGPELLPTLRAYAASVDVTDSRRAALAYAAAAASGDASAAQRLVDVVAGGALPGAFTYQLANELRAAGRTIAFRVYAELLLDEQYAFAAAQAFARIDGFSRRVGWREVKDERRKLYEEFRAWLDGHWSSLVYDAKQALFVVAK
jgi:hypothetical protein